VASASISKRTSHPRKKRNDLEERKKRLGQSNVETSLSKPDCFKKLNGSQGRIETIRQESKRIKIKNKKMQKNAI